MSEIENKEVLFKETIDYLFDSYGGGSQEGVKAGLKECQKMFDCVSLSHQQQIADVFQLDQKIISALMKRMPSVKESIVEYEVVCCTGSRCAKNGSFEVLRVIKETLGINFDETTKDQKIRLSTQNCFKQCHLGPNIMVNGEFHHHMDPAKATLLMKKIKSSNT